MILVTKVEYLTGYKVRLAFNNGVVAVLDFEQILKNDTRKPIQDLLDSELFCSCRLELDTISWKNGVDFAPEFLFEMIKKTAVA